MWSTIHFDDSLKAAGIHPGMEIQALIVSHSPGVILSSKIDAGIDAFGGSLQSGQSIMDGWMDRWIGGSVNGWGIGEIVGA